MSEATDYLLDSHILIWSLYEPGKLPARYLPVLEGDGRTWISAATVWEVEIKRQAGRLPIPADIWKQAADVGHAFLAIEPGHALLAAALPMHHTDPFDRMLVAQATIEHHVLLTVDADIRRYELPIV